LTVAEFRKNPQINATIRKAANRGAQRAAQTCASLIRRGLGRGAYGTPSAPGTPPNTQTGLLRNSINVAKVSDGFYRTISAARYSRIQEFGHPNVRPVKAKAIPVPLNHAAKVILQRSGGNLRAAMPNARVVNRKGKPPLLVGREKFSSQKGYKGGKKVIDRSRPAFLLVKQVRIPARPFFGPVLNRNRTELAAAARQGVAEVMKGGA
jgi:hypothetical protein